MPTNYANGSEVLSCNICFYEGEDADYIECRGRSYCDVCANRHLTVCSVCDRYETLSDAIIDADGNAYCTDCADELLTYCRCCSTWRCNDEFITYGRQDYCQECADEHFTSCDSCGELTPRDDAVYTDDGIYCRDCGGTSDYSDWEGSSDCDRIGSLRRFGVELESSGGNYIAIRNECPGWGIHNDGSIYGKEYVSPVLYGNDGLAEIERFCACAAKHGVSVDKRCGYHLHLDMRDMSNRQIAKILLAYHRSYSIFWERIVPASRRGNSYCRPITDFHRIDDLYDERLSIPFDRYCFINVCALNKHGTLEVRLHSATFDACKIINWIVAHIRFTEWAANADIAEIDALDRAKIENIIGAECAEYYKQREKELNSES